MDNSKPSTLLDNFHFFMRTLISLTFLFLYSCQMITVTQLPCIFGEWVAVGQDPTTDHIPITFLRSCINEAKIVLNKNNSATLITKEGLKHTSLFKFDDTGICFFSDSIKMCSKRVHVDADTMWIDFDNLSLRFQRPQNASPQI